MCVIFDIILQIINQSELWYLCSTCKGAESDFSQNNPAILSFQSVIMASQNVNPTVSSGMLDKDAADRSSATSSAQVSISLMSY